MRVCTRSSVWTDHRAQRANAPAHRGVARSAPPCRRASSAAAPRQSHPTNSASRSPRRSGVAHSNAQPPVLDRPARARQACGWAAGTSRTGGVAVAVVIAATERDTSALHPPKPPRHRARSPTSDPLCLGQRIGALDGDRRELRRPNGRRHQLTQVGLVRDARGTTRTPAPARRPTRPALVEPLPTRAPSHCLHPQRALAAVAAPCARCPGPRSAAFARVESSRASVRRTLTTYRRPRTPPPVRYPQRPCAAHALHPTSTDAALPIRSGARFRDGSISAATPRSPSPLRRAPRPPARPRFAPTALHAPGSAWRTSVHTGLRPALRVVAAGWGAMGLDRGARGGGARDDRRPLRARDGDRARRPRPRLRHRLLLPRLPNHDHLRPAHEGCVCARAPRRRAPRIRSAPNDDRSVTRRRGTRAAPRAGPAPPPRPQPSMIPHFPRPRGRRGRPWPRPLGPRAGVLRGVARPWDATPATPSATRRARTPPGAPAYHVRRATAASVPAVPRAFTTHARALPRSRPIPPSEHDAPDGSLPPRRPSSVSPSSLLHFGRPAARLRLSQSCASSPSRWRWRREGRP